MRRMRNPNELFVGDLSYFCREEQLVEVFSTFGAVVDARVKRSDSKSKTLMYGFVRMETLKGALVAAKEMNGRVFMGRKMKVELSMTSTPSQHEAHHTPQSGQFQVHVSFASSFSNNAVVEPDEGKLRSIFEPFGEIVDIVVKEFTVHPDNRQEGYGFITFADENAALLAAQQCAVVEFCGIRIESAISHRSRNATSSAQSTPYVATHNAPRTVFSVPMLSLPSYGFGPTGPPMSYSQSPMNVHSGPMGWTAPVSPYNAHTQYAPPPGVYPLAYTSHTLPHTPHTTHTPHTQSAPSSARSLSSASHYDGVNHVAQSDPSAVSGMVNYTHLPHNPHNPHTTHTPHNAHTQPMTPHMSHTATMPHAVMMTPTQSPAVHGYAIPPLPLHTQFPHNASPYATPTTQSPRGPFPGPYWAGGWHE